MNCKAALIMSFICPGLGQLYKREILKGISFIMICALLIVSLFFLHSPPLQLYYFGLSVLLLIWLVGIIDAYVDDEFIMERKRWLAWQRLLAVVPVIAIFIAVIVLIVLWMQDFSETNRRIVASASARTVQNIPILEDRADNTDTDTKNIVKLDDPGFFSIQVASFRELERADRIRRDLLARGYTVELEQTVAADEIWHRVMVGKFSSEQDAVSFTETLRKRERFSNVVVRRRSSGNNSADSP